MDDAQQMAMATTEIFWSLPAFFLLARTMAVMCPAMDTEATIFALYHQMHTGYSITPALFKPDMPNACKFYCKL
ncbi:hypothetical protein BX070DRAFT_228431 [Coemansia spiralis]|nr:hypothetical protein BX070DRAFT_228431 [Coemansia spiralis]